MLKNIVFRLDLETAAELDALAEKRGVSRSVLLVTSVKNYLQSLRPAAPLPAQNIDLSPLFEHFKSTESKLDDLIDRIGDFEGKLDKTTQERV